MMRFARAVSAAAAIGIAVFANGALAQKPQAQQAPSPAQQPPTILGLKIPDKVGGLAHAAPFDFEKTNPGLGYSIEFLRPGWRIDVYIYDMRMKSIPDDLDSEVIKKQFAQATDDIFALEKRGTYAKVTAKGDYSIERGGQTRFLCSAFSYVHTQSAVTVDSYLCLTSWKNKFFKIRMTTPQNGDSRSEADKFAEAWIKVLWPS